jgi:hypothetical protein
MAVITIGVSIGQNRDLTAIAVAERESSEGASGKTETHHSVRRLESLPVGQSYHDVAARVAEIADSVYRRTEKRPKIYVEVTGIGTPVLDVLQHAGAQRLTPVFLTDGAQRVASDKEVKLGKAFLVSRLQVLLETGRLHLPETAEARALARELLECEITTEANARDISQAFQKGNHDHLVTALGLAVQEDTSGARPGKIITFPGPGTENPYRNPRADRAVREWLDGLSWPS